MDGDRTVQEIWDAACAHLGDEAPTQEEIIRLLGQLHSADALLCDVSPDSIEVFRRYQQNQRMKWKQRLWTPLALRFPIFDPDKFLQRTLKFVSPLFSWFGIVLWLIVVGTAVGLAIIHWTDLTRDVMDRILAPSNLLLLWLIYPFVKAVHEFGHAYATKNWGGEVHEIGIMLLVLTPVPYVDASSSLGFRNKYKRMLVGAIGIMAELFIGSLALFVWLNVEPGAISSVSYNIMLICGISTLFFNGNPLLRFDGYYVFNDLIEVPNLGTRSNKYLGYLVQKYVFKVKDVDSPANTTGERVWMVIYGIASFIYRLFIMFVIIIFIAGKFFLIGVLLAMWAIGTQVLTPIGKSIYYLLDNPRLRYERGRAITLTIITLLIVVFLLFVVPAPDWTRAQGVVWVPEKSQVRAQADGFITKVLEPENTQVTRSQPLIETRDPFLKAQVEVLQAQYRQLQAELDAAMTQSRVQTEIIREEMSSLKARLNHYTKREKELLIRSPTNGRLIIPHREDLPGHFVRQGQLIAYVLRPGEVTARVVVSQADITKVRQDTRGVAVMLAGWDAEPVPARILREVPAATNKLPTAALGSTGGGPFAVDPSDDKGLTTLERIFQLDVTLPKGAQTDFLGSRVYVRFRHDPEPVGMQIYRALRQLMLREFNV